MLEVNRSSCSGGLVGSVLADVAWAKCKVWACSWLGDVVFVDLSDSGYADKL